MKTPQLSNFVSIDSIYGTFIVNRYCHYQAESLIKTGKTHIESELEKIFSFIDRLPNNSIIIDGGTNIGFFSIPVAQRVKEKNSKVIGFEPQRMIFNAISGSIALNDLDNCFVYNMGLSETSGNAQLPNIDYSKDYDFGTISINSSIIQISKDYLDDKIIQTISIDELQLPRLDFIKLDIEGHEDCAISGGINTIIKYRPILWVEYSLTGLDKIVNQFRNIPGYSFRIMDPQNMILIPVESENILI